MNALEHPGDAKSPEAARSGQPLACATIRGAHRCAGARRRAAGLACSQPRREVLDNKVVAGRLFPRLLSRGPIEAAVAPETAAAVWYFRDP